MDANLNHEIHKEPQLVHVEPSKVEETFAPESVEGSKGTEGYKKQHSVDSAALVSAMSEIQRLKS